MNKSIQQTDDEIMGKCLDELVNYKTSFIHYFVQTIKAQENIREIDFPNLSEAMKERRDRSLSGLSDFFKEAIRMMGGIPALVQFEKEGEGLLSDCIVIPIEKSKE